MVWFTIFELSMELELGILKLDDGNDPTGICYSDSSSSKGAF